MTINTTISRTINIAAANKDKPETSVPRWDPRGKTALCWTPRHSWGACFDPRSSCHKHDENRPKNQYTFHNWSEVQRGVRSTYTSVWCCLQHARKQRAMSNHVRDGISPDPSIPCQQLSEATKSNMLPTYCDNVCVWHEVRWRQRGVSHPT